MDRMAKFIEVYFHFEGKNTVIRNIINVDEIARVEEYPKLIAVPGGGWKEYVECILIRKDGVKCIMEPNHKNKTITELLEL